MEIKRHFYNQKEYFLDEDNQVLKLAPDFLEKLTIKKLWNKFGFKKIGGSSIGDVLLSDQYKSQFNAFANISWLGIPILDRKYVDAGIAIEPKVIDAIVEKTGKKVTTYDVKEYEYDFFKGKDPVLGGIPDGFIESNKKVIEIKTTGEKNLEKWNKYGVPKGYLLQAQLYAYLMNANSFAIVATFLREEDYIDPENYPIKKRKMKSWNFPLEIDKAEDNILKVKEWYKKHTLEGVSPKYDLKKDADLIEWLKCKNKNEWETLKQNWIHEGKIKINE